MQKEKRSNSNNEVVIKLQGWQIPRLLGALRLGIRTEDWCAALIQSGIGTYDTHSARWMVAVGNILKAIKDQTDINEEDTEYGFKDALKIIDGLVEKECVKNEEALDKFYLEREREEANQELLEGMCDLIKKFERTMRSESIKRGIAAKKGKSRETNNN